MANYFHDFQPIFDDTDQEMDAQLLALYHDSRGGQIVRSIFFQDHQNEYGNIRVEEDCFTDPENITFLNRENFFTDDRQDDYVSLATFMNSARKRTGDNLYNRSAMYIDIDCHDEALSEEKRQEILACAADKLTTAYDIGVLPVPTFINHTGRGLACFYVLERSINANIKETKKTLLAFQNIYARLVGKYAYVLEGCGAGVDTCVTDAARIVRVAGTKNTKNGEVCHMLFLQTGSNGITYVPSLHFFDAYLSGEPARASIRGAWTQTQAEAILTRRLDALMRLIELRKRDSETLRHMTLFVIYQTVRAMKNDEISRDILYRCNFMYARPLPERELLSIIASTERMIARKGNVYFYTNKRIRSMLGITDEEAQAMHFGETKRMKERREATQKHRTQRQERNEEIYALWKAGASTRALAEQFNRGIRTIELIVRKMREAEAAVQAEETMTQAEEADEKMEAASVNDKTDDLFVPFNAGAADGEISSLRYICYILLKGCRAGAAPEDVRPVLREPPLRGG